MAENYDDSTIHWVEPRQRGILPLDDFHVPRSLRKTMRRGLHEIRIDTAFESVIRSCAEPTPTRPQTWLNPELIGVYIELHRRGHAHSVEVWRDDRMLGGLYGLALGAAFFGESMFSRAPDASKIALVDLVTRLNAGGFVLLDAQFVTNHLQRFGAVEISRATYLGRLRRALSLEASFPIGAYPSAGAGPGTTGSGATGGGSGSGSIGSAQPITQTS